MSIRSRQIYCALGLLLWLATAFHGRAQGFQADNPGTGSIPVDGTWSFHLGDNPQWALPNYPDNDWEQLRVDNTWGAQTHPAYTGFAWYRRHIRIRASQSHSPELAVLFPNVDDAYEVFWNGRKLGQYGRLPPNAAWPLAEHSAIYALPPNSGSLDGTLSIRVWKAALFSNDPATLGGLQGAPLIGQRQVLDRVAAEPLLLHQVENLPRMMMMALTIIGATISTFLFLRQRTQWQYLWLTLYLVGDTLLSYTHMNGPWYGWTMGQMQLAVELGHALHDICIWLLLLSLLGLDRERRWRRATAICAAIYLAAQAADLAAIVLWWHGTAALIWCDAITTAIYTSLELYIFVLLIAGLRRRPPSALWPLLAITALTGLWNMLQELENQGTRLTGWSLVTPLHNWTLYVNGAQLDQWFLTNLALVLVLLVTVGREQLAAGRRQRALELELHSAQEVQRILIPEAVPEFPGFTVASVYKPAEEVGGDFFQIIPVDDSLLILLGDVSGKGLRAAMTVSLIVGAARTLADATTSPPAILEGLNRRLLGRTSGGFATCLAMLVEPSGHVSFSNAGHLPPFLDGQELSVPGSLPLGLVEGAEYETDQCWLHEGECLTLYTDGVLEARNDQGELFGFDRVASLLARRPRMQQIVDEVVAFGQEDDITVLSLTRLASPELSLISTQTQVTSSRVTK